MVIMWKNISLMMLLCSSIEAQAAYHGIVYVDSNRNGLCDPTEKRLEGVAVSDGLNVVKTKSDGSFSLKGYEGTRFIFISTPAGYKSDNKHYIPIMGGTKDYDFGLQVWPRGATKDGQHRFIHISDTEISSVEGQARWVKNLKDAAENEEVAFIMHTGDLCYEKGLKSHIKLMNTARMNCPVFYANGNHDLVKGKYGEELFESLYGPTYYSFNMGKIHYIVTPMAGGDYRPSYTVDQVARWMKNDLAQIKKGTPIVVFNHDLLTTGNSWVYGKADTMRLDDYNLKAWLYGHWHNHYVHRQGKVLAICTAPVNMGGIDHSTAAYRLMRVSSKGNLYSELRYASMDAFVRIASVAGGRTPMQKNGEILLSVNAYNSGAEVRKMTAVCLTGHGKQIGKLNLHKTTDWNWAVSFRIPRAYQNQSLKWKVTAFFSDGTRKEDTSAFKGSLPSTLVYTNDWVNMAGNAQHTAWAADSLKTPLRLAWVANVGSNLFMTSPLIYKGNVYVASVDENGTDRCAVFALDGESGKMLWKCPTEYSVRNTITIAGGKVFAQDIAGKLYQIDAVTGKLVKKENLPIPGLPVLDEGLVSEGDTVYAGSGQGLCAIDARTGNRLWINKGWGRGEGTTATWSVGANNLIANAEWRYVYANDKRTGVLQWKQESEGLRFHSSSPSVHGSLLYTLSDHSFFILDEKTGRIVVRKPLESNVNVTSTPLLTEQEIILGTADGIMALDNHTLDVKWVFRTKPALVQTVPYTHYPVRSVETTPILCGDKVFMGASDGGFYALEVHTGKVVWQHQTGAPVFSTAAVSGHMVVYTDFGGNIYAFSGE